MTLGQKLMNRLDAFARQSSEDGALTRLFLTQAHRQAVDDLMEQLRGIGLSPWLDAMGNVQARYAGLDPHAPTVMIGSHIDTVRNAGRFDGTLGVFVALGVIEELAKNGNRLRRGLDFIAFGDEEGVRFPTTLGGSRALAGSFDMATLGLADAEGVTLETALRAFGCDPSGIPALARKPGSLHAYLEPHIEQGPVLEAEDLALGIVSAINGASRYSITLTGLAGHAGTVPMALRRDALAAAAEIISAIEARALAEPDLVATVGRIEALPGAVNVIPGEARLTLDVRAPDDAQRRKAAADCLTAMTRIAGRRGIGCEILPSHDADAMKCDPIVQQALATAILETGRGPIRYLPSGAGHDATAMAALCPAGMLFVRCKGGISHNPLESITLDDAEAVMAVTIRAVDILAA
jgi:allantoate deiminase